MTYTAHDFLGALLASESEQPHEWPFVGQVAINRLHDSKHEFKRLVTIRDVVLQPSAWSWFNRLTLDAAGRPKETQPTDDEVFLAIRDGYPGRRFSMARVCADELLNQPPWRATMPPGWLFCWAPAAMKPAGSDPRWAAMLTIYDLPTVPRWRFAAYPS